MLTHNESALRVVRVRIDPAAWRWHKAAAIQSGQKIEDYLGAMLTRNAYQEAR